MIRTDRFLRFLLPVLPVLVASPGGPLAGEESTSPAGKSALIVDKSVYEWGSVYEGQVVEHTFTLTNGGTAPLTVKEIKPKCGCTVARDNPKNKLLKPGDSLQITLQVETATFHGALEKDADIITDPVMENPKLWMQGRVTKVLSFQPKSAILKLIRDDEKRPAKPVKVRVISEIRQPLQIDSVTSEKKFVSAAVAKTGTGFELELKSLLPLSTKNARNVDKLELRAKLDGKELKFPYTVEVRFLSRIEVNPSQSFFFPRKLTSKAKEEGKQPVKVLDIQSLGGPAHRFHITKIKTEKNRVRTHLETVKEGRHYRLTVELLPPPAKATFVRDKILIETDDPLVPEITIPGLAKFSGRR